MKASLLVLIFLCCAAPLFAQSATVKTDSDTLLCVVAAPAQAAGNTCIAVAPNACDTSIDTSAVSASASMREEDYSAGASTILATKKICWLPFKRATFS
ncbi:MAG: hypothetical protein HY962_08055 [Ignavibacteriae bacterium]|nr:hypothetical protein [Ignavibacteriota bacterium]